MPIAMNGSLEVFKQSWMEMKSLWSPPMLQTVKGILIQNSSSLLIYSLFSSVWTVTARELTVSPCYYLPTHTVMTFPLIIGFQWGLALCNLDSSSKWCTAKGFDQIFREIGQGGKISFFLHYPPEPSNPQQRHNSHIGTGGLWIMEYKAGLGQ